MNNAEQRTTDGRTLGEACRDAEAAALPPVRSEPLLAMLSDEESRFRGMQKIMEHDGQTDTAMQMRYIAAGIEHARIRIEHMIANTKPHRQEPAAGSQYGGGSGSAQNGGDL